MSDDDAEVRAPFRALLSAERAGYKLATALVSTLVSYLVGTVELSDVAELDIQELLTTAEEAWASMHGSGEHASPSSCCPIPPTRGACPFGGSSLGHSVEWGVPARVCVRS